MEFRPQIVNTALRWYEVQFVPTSLGYAKCNVLKLRKVCERSELSLQSIDSNETQKQVWVHDREMMSILRDLKSPFENYASLRFFKQEFQIEKLVLRM